MDMQMKHSPLRKYVLTKENKDYDKLSEISLCWAKASIENKLSYEIDWLGIPVIQSPEDLILVQQVIYNVAPDYVIETGVAHGGSLIFYASILEAIGHGTVIGIDIDIRKHNRQILEKHRLFKRIELIEGDSTSQEVGETVRKKISPRSKVLVCLDSNHYKDHVLKELEIYSNFVGIGSYIVVFDTITSLMSEHGVCDPSYINNGPREAIDVFLQQNQNFRIDGEFNKLFVSYSPDGYLKRIS
ncbi:MAG: cephalosporin hydroxylase [Planctomycetaceae bacterium]|nr:cephalosporin hydroxylase [Planctomycetaceae bacterium]